MIVKVYYAGGRIDVFDTDHLIDGIPQPGNLLTNYTLDLADVNGESLWLCSCYHEAADAYKDQAGPKGLPVARRRDGWSFLVADADDMAKLNRVTVDGETVLVQMAGELVDVAALSWAYDVAEEYRPMALAAYRGLVAMRSGEFEDVRTAACSAVGVSLQTFETIEKASAVIEVGAARF